VVGGEEIEEGLESTQEEKPAISATTTTGS
jgi:hypothetical protein